MRREDSPARGFVSDQSPIYGGPRDEEDPSVTLNLKRAHRTRLRDACAGEFQLRLEAVPYEAITWNLIVRHFLLPSAGRLKRARPQRHLYERSA